MHNIDNSVNRLTNLETDSKSNRTDTSYTSKPPIDNFTEMFSELAQRITLTRVS